MKKALIIGINGFAGSYLRKELEGSYDVYGADIASFDDKVSAIDMLDEKAFDGEQQVALRELVGDESPENTACLAHACVQAKQQRLQLHSTVKKQLGQ